MDSPKPPPAPDPAATAAAQGAMNKETALTQARLNMFDQYSPYGSTTYSEIPDSEVDGVPRYEQRINLSPEQQERFDIEQGLSVDMGRLAQGQIGRIENNISDPFSYEGLPEAPTMDDGYRTRVEDALFQRINPQLEQDRERLETQLINSGFSRGTEAYNEQMDQFNRQLNDARLAVASQGGNEMSRIFGLESAARDRGIQEQLALRNQPINELAGLLGTGPGVQMPQFTSNPQTAIAAPDYQGAVGMKYAGDMNAYNSQMQSRNATMGGLFGLGGAGLGGFTRGKGFQNWVFN